MRTSKTGAGHKSIVICVYEGAQQQSKKLGKQEAGSKGFAEDRARKRLKQDSEKESRRKKKYNGTLLKETQREPRFYKRGGRKEAERQRPLQLVQSAGSR